MSTPLTDLPLEPIETASRQTLQTLQLERLKWSLRHAYDHSPVYRRKFDQAGVHPDQVQSLADLARSQMIERRTPVPSPLAGSGREPDRGHTQPEARR